MKSRIEYIIKNNIVIQKIYRFSFSKLFQFIGLFVKIDENLVLINSFAGKRYNDSPRVIYDYLISDAKFNHLKIVWAFENPSKYNSIPNKVKIDTLKYFIIALKAKYWISNVNIERGLRFKKKNTRYLNTWHGTPIKLVGNAAGNRKDFDYSNVNILCCESEYQKEIFIRDMKALEKNILLKGRPVNDILFHLSNEYVNRLKSKYRVPVNKKVILYAPTWRESNDKGKTFVFESPIDLSLWKKELEDNYVLFLKTHTFTTKVKGFKFDEFIRDATNFEDITELLIISDILITDYSSVMFDFSILNRPIICYAYDYDEYKLKRGFYFDLSKEMPFGIFKTQKEVINKIKSLDSNTENLKTKRLKSKYATYGGDATKECVKALFE